MTQRAFTNVTRRCERCDDRTRQRKRRTKAGGWRYECKGCEARRREKNRTKNLWRTMVYRCTNPAANNWRYYGGKGIRVCQRWIDSFEAFLGDVGERPSSDHSLDRIDPSGNYEPGNVRWATKEQQAVDAMQWLTVYGERKRIESWAEETGLTRQEIVQRLKDGWTPAQVVTVPPGGSRWSLSRRRA